MPASHHSGQAVSQFIVDWFGALGLSIEGIHASTLYDIQNDLDKAFEDVANSSLGNYKGTPIALSLDPQIAPIHLKARSVPFTFRAMLEAELDKLVAQGIL